MVITYQKHYLLLCLAAPLCSDWCGGRFRGGCVDVNQGQIGCTIQVVHHRGRFNVVLMYGFTVFTTNFIIF